MSDLISRPSKGGRGAAGGDGGGGGEGIEREGGVEEGD